MSSFQKARLASMTLLMPLAVTVFASSSLADDETVLDLTFAAGVSFGPDYEGSDDYEVSLVPYVELSAFDGLASISPEGIQAFLPLGDSFAIGGGLSYGGGRDEDDNDDLEGLGDIDDSVIGSASAIAALGEVELGLTFAHSLGGDVEGYTIDLILGREIEVIEGRLDLEFGAGVTWASESYTDTYFGINADQAAASGLDETDVDAGFKSASVEVTGNYYLTDRLALGLDLEYQRLLGDAADSPIVKDEGDPNQFSAVAYLAVEFGFF